MYHVFWKNIDGFHRSTMTKRALENFLVSDGKNIAWMDDINHFNFRGNEGIIIKGDIVVPVIETHTKVTV